MPTPVIAPISLPASYLPTGGPPPPGNIVQGTRFNPNNPQVNAGLGGVIGAIGGGIIGGITGGPAGIIPGAAAGSAILGGGGGGSSSPTPLAGSGGGSPLVAGGSCPPGTTPVVTGPAWNPTFSCEPYGGGPSFPPPQGAPPRFGPDQGLPPVQVAAPSGNGCRTGCGGRQKVRVAVNGPKMQGYQDITVDGCGNRVRRKFDPGNIKAQARAASRLRQGKGVRDRIEKTVKKALSPTRRR